MGLRNEEARLRRRQKLKKQFNLTSVSDNELEYEAGLSPSQKPTLSNHFLWVVLGKSQVGDGSFPHLSQYHEKPDISGRDFEKVTYVLYMAKGGDVIQSVAKQTQTTLGGPLRKTVSWSEEKEKSVIETQKVKEEDITENDFEDDEEESEDEEPIEDVKKAKGKRNGKMISNFYYRPKDHSRSPQKVEQESVIQPGGSDVKNNLQKSTVKSDVKEVVSKEAGKRRGYKQDRWKLRAGAEHFLADLNESQMFDPKFKIKRVSTIRFDSRLYLKSVSRERLLDSPSGTNKYLYVTNRNKKRKVKYSRANTNKSL
ncbi:hypothetical protein J6590_057159 [Homalodisca vitripennis]|nr:hypothetical protein J6590_057159 [Homalodisca vitripennis]